MIVGLALAVSCVMAGCADGQTDVESDLAEGDAGNDSIEVSDLSDTADVQELDEIDTIDGDADDSHNRCVAEHTEDGGDEMLTVFDANGHEPGTFGLRELHGTGLELRQHPGEAGEAIGFGGTLIDYDGDGDLDVYVGARAKSGNPGCMFENQSSSGDIQFIPVASYCENGDHAITASAVDFDEDGRHELITAELDRIRYIPDPTAPSDSYIVMDDQCSALEVFPFDLDRDGVPEIVAACAASDGVRAWTWNGGVEFSEVEMFPDANGSTEAVAVYDINEDGLLDLQLGTITRTPSASDPNGAVELHRDPGGAYIRQPRGGFTKFLHGEGIAAYGDPMGFVRYWNAYQDRYEFAYSDWGKNPVLRWRDEGFESITDDIGNGAAQYEGFLLASWAMLLDDFNRDHRDDIFMTQGQMFTRFDGGSSDTLGANEEHRNYLLMQDEFGSFDAIDDPESVPGNSEVTEAMNFEHWSSRGALRADLDADGTLEILVFGLEGPVRVFQEFHEVAPPGRCTLVLESRYTFGFGYGFGIRSASDAPFRALESLGQYMVVSSNWLTTVWPRGEVMFPSGHIEHFACAEAGEVIHVQEPEWIFSAREQDDWSITVNRSRHVSRAAAGEIRAHCMDDDDDRVFPLTCESVDGAEHFRGVIDGGCTSVMIQLGDRYVDFVISAPQNEVAP